MFSPTQIWRKWHVKVAVNQRRYALVSALAASALPALVMARGHSIDQVPEVPLVVGNEVNDVKKTAAAVKILAKLGAADDVDKVKNSKKLRAGRGKMRNRRYTQRRGPLVIYDKDDGIVKAFRNIQGVDLCNVSRLNLLQLAPGGHVGRFCIWTADAFEKLDKLYGSQIQESELKKGYKLPRAVMTNSDLTRIINSDEIQCSINPAKETRAAPPKKVNPLKSKKAMLALNPNSKNIKKVAPKGAKPKDGEKFYKHLTA